MKITVAGTGYVGLSMAVLLSQNNDVTAVDIVPEKVELVNSRKSPIADKYIEEYLAEKPLSLAATTDWRQAYASADIVVIATPTNYDAEKNYFDTSSVESVIEQVFSVNDHCTIVVKSTVPVGFTAGLHKKYPENAHRIIFLAGVPPRGSGAVRQPVSLPHYRGSAAGVGGFRGARERIRGTSPAGCDKAGYPDAAPEPHRGRGGQAVQQYLPRRCAWLTSTSWTPTLR